jgi:CheY-like chemotaxis protein
MANLIIVEDDLVLLAGMKDLLSMEGHQVRAVSSGQAALQAIEAEPPELVVCDIVMPEMSGTQLLEVVRTCSDWSAIPFLFVSASTMPEMEKQIAALGGVSYLRKPFEIDRLCEAVAVATEACSGPAGGG